jgi:ribosomal protein S18 acetylase RimI-like enzyme
LQYKNGSLWAYRDRNNALVGFGSLDFCDEYARFVGGRPHQYIPLLAVNPSMRGQGFGKQILNHLVDQAALIWACSPQSCDLLFLDVYASNETAIGLYKRFEFAEISDERSPTRIKAATHTLSWLEGYPSHEIRLRRHLNESSVEKPARTFQQLSSIR